MSAGVWVLIVAVVGAVAFGLFRALTDGRFRGTHLVRGVEPTPAPDPKVTEAPTSLLDGTPWAERPRRARDAAAVLLGVLRALPGDASGAR